MDTLQNTAIVVLGMHRGGTSATSGVLRLLGVPLGDKLMVPDAHNPTGYWEHAEIPFLHNEMLATLGYRWSDPRPLPENWVHDPRIVAYIDKLRAILLRDFAGMPVWGLKDPRICRLLPLWLPLLESLRVDVRVFLVLRSPAACAASLKNAMDMGEDLAYALWVRLMLSAEQGTRGRPRAILRYDHLLQDWAAEMGMAGHDAGVNLGLRCGDVDAFLTPALRHHGHFSAITESPWVGWAERLYRALGDMRGEGASPSIEGVVDAIAGEVGAADRATNPYTQYFVGLLGEMWRYFHAPGAPNMP